MAPGIVHFPEMALTLVRRVSAKLPYNNFLFRTDPKWTKLEIREYLEKVYNVKVANLATSISMGAIIMRRLSENPKPPLPDATWLDLKTCPIRKCCCFMQARYAGSLAFELFSS